MISMYIINYLWQFAWENIIASALCNGNALNVIHLFPVWRKDFLKPSRYLLLRNEILFIFVLTSVNLLFLQSKKKIIYIYFKIIVFLLSANFIFDLSFYNLFSHWNLFEIFFGRLDFNYSHLCGVHISDFEKCIDMT